MDHQISLAFLRDVSELLKGWVDLTLIELSPCVLIFVCIQQKEVLERTSDCIKYQWFVLPCFDWLVTMVDERL